MATAITVSVSSVALGTSTATLYTVPSGKRFIGSFIITIDRGAAFVGGYRAINDAGTAQSDSLLPLKAGTTIRIDPGSTNVNYDALITGIEEDDV